ncbi:MAG TPA: YwiC-like family protein [Microthrixaceae bacterium]|nr:YwiC-like family protein [Microthrixaceae bacterium]
MTTTLGGPRERPSLRAVALPTEHGGWGLTLEPCLLGLLIAPSVAGVCLTVAAMLAFLVRTPLKLVLVDRRRGRTLPRTHIARRVALIEGVALAALVGVAAWTAEPGWWVPAAIAAPLVALQSWYDQRSRSRRLVPEIAGAVAVCAAASMIVLADGGEGALAIAVWVVLAARAVTSITHVRDQIARVHQRPVDSRSTMVADAVAILLAAAAVAVEPRVLAGAIAVAMVIVIQRVSAIGPPPRAVVIGVRQLLLGVFVVAATAVGVIVTT